MYGDNIPFPRDLRHVLKLAQEHTEKQFEDAANAGGMGRTQPASTILSKSTIEFIDGGDGGGLAMFDYALNIEAGNSYDLTFYAGDGQTAVYHTDKATDDNGSIGAMISEMGDGCFITVPSPEMAEMMGAKSAIRINAPGTYTISIAKPETIHPIHPKFLPGVCLPVFRITPEFVGRLTENNVIPLSAAEQEFFETATQNLMPIVFQLKFGEAPDSMSTRIVNLAGYEEGFVYELNVLESALRFSKLVGLTGWYAELIDG